MTFNLVQTVFALNMAANAVAGIDDTPQNLQSLFDAYINGGPLVSPYGVYEPNSSTFTTTAPGFFNSLNPSDLAGGDWEVVWGPAVYVDLAKDMPTGEATNSAFVAKSASNNAYVVAIAGTNFKSLKDWLAEDLDVDPASRTEWPNFNPAGLSVLTQQHGIYETARIDAGSVLGVTNLVTKLTDTTQPAGMETLAGFLQKLPSTQGYLKGSTLYFTGHSLGGALTQVIGLYLYAQLMADGWAKISTLPTAGPTPGNLGFAMFYNNIFKPESNPTNCEPVPYWSADVISSGDVVPAAWNNLTSAFTLDVDAAGNYASFYGELAPDPIDLKILWLKFEVSKQPFGKVMGDLMAAISAVTDFFYSPVTQFAFTPTPGYYARNEGYVSWEPMPLATDADPIPDLKALGPYVFHAHTSQYNYFFGIGVVPQFPTKPNTSQA